MIFPQQKPKMMCRILKGTSLFPHQETQALGGGHQWPSNCRRNVDSLATAMHRSGQCAKTIMDKPHLRTAVEPVQDDVSVTDLAYQAAFRIAHSLLRIYWWFRRPRKGGILVAVWHLGKILVVKNSYRRQYTLPGGYPMIGESPAETGSRELLEECGIHVPVGTLREVYRGEFLFEHRHDEVLFMEAELSGWPRLRIDHREVSEARFVDPIEVGGLLAVPHLTDFLQRLVTRPVLGPLAAAMAVRTPHGGD